MEWKNHPFIVLLCFLTITPQIIHSKLNCSQVLCKYHSNIDCTSMDVCECDATNLQALCPSFSSKEITIHFDKYSNSFGFNGFQTEVSLPAAMQLWMAFLANEEMMNLTKLSVNSFCTLLDVGFESSKQCSVVDSRLRVLDVNELPVLNLLVELMFSFDCLENVSGDFDQKFPNLTRVDLSNNFLSEIPRGLQGSIKLQKLDISRNIIRKITRNNFQYLTTLTALQLFSNCIETLPIDVLYDLTNLESFGLPNNQISELPLTFLAYNKLLTEFDVSNNRLTGLPDDLFRNNQRLKSIALNNNQLEFLPETLLDGLTQLENLDLFDNNLVDLPPKLFYSSYNVKIVNLYRNKFTEIPLMRQSFFAVGGPFSIDLSSNNISVLHVPITKRIPKALMLTLSNNCVQYIDYDDQWKSASDDLIKVFNCQRCCLKDIRPHMFDGFRDILDVSSNEIRNITAQTLEAVKRFENVDFGYNEITSVNMSDFHSVFPFEQDGYGRKFILTGNPIICDCNAVGLVKFIKYNNNREKFQFVFEIGTTKCSAPSTMKNQLVNQLAEENLLCVYLEECPSGCYCKAKTPQNSSNVIIDCSFLNLTTFPVFDHGSANLYIVLQHNRITTLPSKDNCIWKRIFYLDLSYNQMNSLANLTRTATNLQVIRLDHNLLDEYQPIISEMVMHNRTVTLSGNPWICNCGIVQMKNLIFKDHYVKDRDNMSCVSPNDGTIHMFYNIDHFCPTDDDSSNHFLIVTILVPVFAIVLIAFVTEEEIDADKEFDAFVSYSGEDSDWVKEFLVAGLESGYPKYTLCLHGRDWIGGVLITDQIIKSVHLSRRTIIVLTNNFLASNWSRFEFDIAYQQAMNDQVRRLIVVIPDQVPDLSTTDKEFSTFISLTTYLEASKPYFWRKLRSSMPRTHNLIENKVSDAVLELENVNKDKENANV
uniref:TIR domain-containing protein n=1 Tax=Strigamia maritima TaxID=126957 RepID=T1IHT5_STRMM